MNTTSPRRQIPRASLLLALLAGCAPAASTPAAAPEPAPAASAPALDRSTPPPERPAPDVDLPEVQRRTLSNGLAVWVVEQRELPLVTLRLVVDAGSAAEPRDRAGLAALTAAMLDEGTRTRTALQIADELDFIGANLSAGADYDAATVGLSTLSRHLPAALDVFADVVTRPAFPERELERVRREWIAGLVESLDRPTTVATEQLALRVYGADHPYGRPVSGTVQTVGRLTVRELQSFYRTYFRPNNATLLVAGDVSADQLVPLLERAFQGWERAEVPAVRYPDAPAAASATRVFLVDKPGAAQSEIRIGHLGVARDHPDYFPLLVLNTVLGGQFSSRINMNLREDKGYTYGARSAFSMRRHPGPFVASAGVQTPSTKESVIEFMKELREIRGSRPVTDQELEFARSSLVRAEPLQLETQGQLLGRLEELALHRLPADYFESYTERIRAVTRAEVERVAREHLHPDRLAIVVVGDRSRVEAGLRELPYPVELVTLERPAIPAGR